MMITKLSCQQSVCRQCKYFMPDQSMFGYGHIKHGLCKHKQAEACDIVTGEISYERAAYMRSNINICGKDGKLFEQEKNEFIKVYRECPVKIMIIIIFIAILRFPILALP